VLPNVSGRKPILVPDPITATSTTRQYVHVKFQLDPPQGDWPILWLLVYRFNKT